MPEIRWWNVLAVLYLLAAVVGLIAGWPIGTLLVLVGAAVVSAVFGLQE